jgi:cytochrome c-type biogenesis protein
MRSSKPEDRNMNTPIEASLALLAGALTVASPCVLPILPVVLGGAMGRSSRIRPLFIVSGFVIAFAALGLLLAGLSQHAAIAQETVRNIGVAVLLLAGLSMLWRAPYEWLIARVGDPLSRVAALGQSGSGNVGGFMLGISLGAVWTPCAGPVLASILVFVAQAQNFTASAWLLFLYALGAGIPMLAIAYGGQLIKARLRVVANHAERIQKIFGALIVLTAFAIYFQYDVLAYAWLVGLLSN